MSDSGAHEITHELAHFSFDHNTRDDAGDKGRGAGDGRGGSEPPVVPLSDFARTNSPTNSREPPWVLLFDVGRFGGDTSGGRYKQRGIQTTGGGGNGEGAERGGEGETKKGETEEERLGGVLREIEEKTEEWSVLDMYFAPLRFFI
jgi:hypothetical protein